MQITNARQYPGPILFLGSTKRHRHSANRPFHLAAMESAQALRFLTPLRVHAAFAAASPTLGEPTASFHQHIHGIIPHPPETLHHTLEKISFVPSSLMARHVNISLSSTPNVSALVKYLVKSMTSTPESMHIFVTVLEPQCDQGPNGAYEHASDVCLFLRKCIVAFQSLSFSAIIHLREKLQSPSAPKKKEEPMDFLRNRDIALSRDQLHKHHDKTTHLKASMALAVYHVSRGMDAEQALEECLRVAQEVNDDVAQAETLEWMAYLRKGEHKAHLLPDDHIALLRENLLGLKPNNRYQILAKGSFRVDILLLKARAWLMKGAVPTALVVAGAAFKRAEPENQSNAGVALANLLILQGDWKGAMHIMDGLKDSLFVRNSRNWMFLGRHLRRGELHLAEVCVDKTHVYVQCADQTQLDVGELEMDTLEAGILWKISAEDFGTAGKLCERLKKRAAVLQRPERSIEAMRLQAESLLRGGTSNKALYCALSAITLARGLNLEYLYVRCVCTLVECMLRLGEECTGLRGMNALEDVFSRAMEGCGIETRAWAMRLWAECEAMDKRETGEMPGEEAVDMMRTARGLYAEADDMWGMRQCLHVLAQIYDERGMIRERDTTAEELFNLDRKLVERQFVLP